MTAEISVKIDEGLFAEIKAAQDDGVTAADVANEMNLSLEKANQVFQCSNFKSFSKLFGTEEQREAAIKVAPNSSKYFRGLIAQKAEENSNLKEQRGWLLE